MKLALAILALPILAQPAVDLRASICGGTQTKLLVVMPATVAGSTVLIPVCVALGAGLRLNPDAAGGPAIEATVTAAGANMRQAYEEIKLDAVPLDKVAIDHTLAATPAPGTYMQVYYRGTTFWTGQFDVLKAAGKAITIYLPYGRLVQGGDVIKLLYWTADLPAVRPVQP